MNNFRPSQNAIDPWLTNIMNGIIQNRDPIFILKYDDGTFESNSYDTASAQAIHGANWFSEKWIQTGNQVVAGINIPLIRSALPADSLYIVLRDETDSQDVATISISVADITTTPQWYEKYFSSPVPLVNGKVYRLILKSPGSTQLASYGCSSLSTQLDGKHTYDGINSFYSASTNSGSSWIDVNTRDLTYILLLSGSGIQGWIVHPPWDGTVDTHAQRCADFAWEYKSAPTYQNQGLLVYGTTAGALAWRRFRAPNYMSAALNPLMGANIHPWIQLRSNPRTINGDVKILGAVLEDTTFRLGGISWDGTTLSIIDSSTFSSATNTMSYECFEIDFELFAPVEKAKLLWRTRDSDYESDPFVIGRAAFTDYSEIRTVNPSTGEAWTWSEVNALEIGSKASALGADEVMAVSDFWLVVNYSDVGNCELDLEVQWINVDFDEDNEELCIFGGAMGSENLRIDVWTGTTWQNVIPHLTNGWNNVTVSTYLGSSSFTIRFKGSIETADAAQDSWAIDATLLHVWS